MRPSSPPEAEADARVQPDDSQEWSGQPGQHVGKIRGRPNAAVPGAPSHIEKTTNRKSRQTGPGERAFLSGREGGHRLQAPHSSHLLKVAWESVG
jgi:hypothetical protein